jgi:hypothetical protein
MKKALILLCLALSACIRGPQPDPLLYPDELAWAELACKNFGGLAGVGVVVFGIPSENTYRVQAVCSSGTTAYSHFKEPSGS